MRNRYLDDFWRGISVFAIFSFGIAVLGTPPNVPLLKTRRKLAGKVSIHSRPAKGTLSTI